MEEVLGKKKLSLFLFKSFFFNLHTNDSGLRKTYKNKIIVKLTTKAKVYFTLNGRVAR